MQRLEYCTILAAQFLNAANQLKTGLNRQRLHPRGRRSCRAGALDRHPGRSLPPSLYPRRNLLKLLFLLFIVAEVRAHEALPQFAVIGHAEMQEFVDDDVVAEVFVEVEEFGVEDEQVGASVTFTSSVPARS